MSVDATAELLSAISRSYKIQKSFPSLDEKRLTLCPEKSYDTFSRSFFIIEDKQWINIVFEHDDEPNEQFSWEIGMAFRLTEEDFIVFNQLADSFTFISLRKYNGTFTG